MTQEQVPVPVIKPHILSEVVLALLHNQVKLHGTRNTWMVPLCVSSKTGFNTVKNVIAEKTEIEVIQVDTVNVYLTPFKYTTFFHLDDPLSFASRAILNWSTKLKATQKLFVDSKAYSAALRSNKNISDVDVTTLSDKYAPLTELTWIFPYIETMTATNEQLKTMQQYTYSNEVNLSNLRCLRIVQTCARNLLDLLKDPLPFALPEELELIHFEVDVLHKFPGKQLKNVKKLTIDSGKNAINLRTLPTYLSAFGSLERVFLTVDKRFDDGFCAKKVVELHTAFASLPKDPKYMITVNEKFRRYTEREMWNSMKELRDMGYRFHSSCGKSEVKYEAVVHSRGNRLTHRVEFSYFRDGFYQKKSCIF